MKDFRSTVAVLAALSLSLTANAQVVWNGAGDGSTWGDDGNWVGGAEPTSSDSIALGGNTVNVNTSANYSVFTNGTTSGSKININSGGTLTSSNAGFFSILRYVGEIEVNSGGSLVTTANADARTNITVNSGATLSGIKKVKDSKTLSIGGLWTPLDSVDGDNAFTIGEGNGIGHVALTASGILQLDLFANATNEFFSLEDTSAGSSSLNLSTGSINLTVQGGYTPMVGDSYDLWDDISGDEGTGNGVLTLGDGSNITLSGYTLDTSNFASTGVVTVVPEPTSVMLLALGGLLLAYRRR